jgi:hypothetical protein
MKFRSIENLMPLNLIILIFIFSVLYFVFHQYDFIHHVYGLYFGNNFIINNGNVSSSITEGKLASSEKGDVYVVWVEKNNTYFSSRHEHDTKFSNPIVLSSNNGLSSSPRISATERGDVYVIWIEKNKNNIVFRKSNDSGNNFDKNVHLNRIGGTNQTVSSPLLAATERGDVYVVWVDKNNIVFRKSNDSGNNFDKSISLDNNVNPSQKRKASLNQTLTPSFSPQLTVTEKGDVYVVWVDKNEANGDTNIAFVRSNTSGNDFVRGKYLRANDLLSFSPQLAATERGDVYVVWVDKNNETGSSTIRFSGSNNSGNDFGDIKRLSRSADPNETSTVFSPQLAATDNGGVYVVWVEKNETGSNNVVFRGSNDFGNDFDTRARLNRNPNQIGFSFSPQIGSTQNGSIFVIWSDNTLQFKQISDGGEIVGRTISLNNQTVLPLSSQIAVTEHGNLYLAWAEQHGNINNDTAFVFKKISEFYFDRN